VVSSCHRSGTELWQWSEVYIKELASNLARLHRSFTSAAVKISVKLEKKVRAPRYNLFRMTVTSKFVLTNVRVFDGHHIGGPRTVVIDGDKIGTDATDAAAIDCEGDILLPGLIDCHLHLRSPKNLEQLVVGESPQL
jgi:hypothetical protein